MVAFVEASPAHRPVVVVLSDLHWADDLVLELIDTLLDRLRRRPFVVLATARQALDERGRRRTAATTSSSLNLDPLDRERAGRAARARWLGGELGAELARRAARPQRRQPVLPRGARRAPGRRPAHGRAEALGATGGAELGVELPDTLRGLVAARLDGLTARRARACSRTPRCSAAAAR